MTLDRETSEALWKMRSSGLPCDGLLMTSDGGAFPVHRVIMASCSEYFRVLFGVRFNIYERSEVLVPGVSSAASAIVVELAYERRTWRGFWRWLVTFASLT
ncbi:hypothetical protein HPB48_016188 [Haemaphysalis longicornis]|uniref:BTB domain-containing protein n=1 Tax=Haemaphysalis longicornis TaxID=44386 RepID=A0A9J6G899_HAELO|nr:hypothetical protein HPB48_016188 [Haemaphysalis longicornis]